MITRFGGIPGGRTETGHHQQITAISQQCLHDFTPLQWNAIGLDYISHFFAPFAPKRPALLRVRLFQLLTA